MSKIKGQATKNMHRAVLEDVGSLSTDATRRAEFDQGFLDEALEQLDEVYLWLYELDKRIERLGGLLGDLQPWVAGKLSVRFLYPKAAKDNEGRRRYGRRPHIVCWRIARSKSGERIVRAGQYTSVTMYDIIKPEDAMKSLRGHTVFAETYGEAKLVLAAILSLMKQRGQIAKLLGDTNRQMGIRRTFVQRKVAEIDYKTDGWEEQVRCITSASAQ